MAKYNGDQVIFKEVKIVMKLGQELDNPLLQKILTLIDFSL